MIKFIELECVNSTNTFAKENIDSFEDKTVITAKSQTGGYGRLSRRWVDLGSENLYMSIVLKPSCDFKDVYTNLTQYLSVVLCQILEGYGINPKIKWPNDILINGKKISGILAQTVIQGEVFKGLVLGVGVNLNANLKDLNKIKDKIATSLNLETEKSIDIENFKNILVEKFFDKYDEFLDKGFCSIKDYYMEKMEYLGKEIVVQLPNKKVRGIIENINSKGELILINNNKEFTLAIGEIL